METKQYQLLKEQFNKKYYKDAETNSSRKSFLKLINKIETRNNKEIYNMSLSELKSNIEGTKYKYVTIKLFLFYIKALYKYLCDSTNEIKYDNKHPIEILKYTDFKQEYVTSLQDMIIEPNEAIQLIEKTYNTKESNASLLYGYVLQYISTFAVDLSLLNNITYKDINFADKTVQCYYKNYINGEISPITIPIDNKYVFMLFFNWYSTVQKLNKSRKETEFTDRLFPKYGNSDIYRKCSSYTHLLAKHIKTCKNILDNEYFSTRIMFKNMRITSTLHRISKTDEINNNIISDVLQTCGTLERKYLTAIENRIDVMYASVQEMVKCVYEYRLYKEL